jgi:hypothetical protein
MNGDQSAARLAHAVLVMVRDQRDYRNLGPAWRRLIKADLVHGITGAVVRDYFPT